MMQYAGKRMRSALVVIEFNKRKPVKVIQAQYFYLYFDTDGRLDPNERKIAHQLASAAKARTITNDGDSQTVINAKQQFAKKRYINNYTWKPSPEIDAEIYNAIFDPNRTKKYRAFSKPWFSSPYFRQLDLPFEKY